MECSSCPPAAARPDRPHTFLHHQVTQCPGCQVPREARVVLRGNETVELVFCKECGQRERVISSDAKGYVQALVARGEDAATAPGEHLFKTTTSTCPQCTGLVPARVMIRDGQVYFHKDCAACGPSQALVSEDAAYYARAYGFARAGTEPHVFATEVSHGCPTDCGTCGDHEQHTCLPIIEVTDHCNLECPICIVDNQYSNHLDVDDFARMVDTLVRNEGQCESIALSGGEPTSHPRIMDLVRIASRPEVGRAVIITNGLRLGRDRKFAQEVKDSGAYVGLQLDGFSAETHERIRGRDLTEDKAAALAVLKEFRIPTQLIAVVARGVNEDQVGQLVELLMGEEHLLSLNFQPAAFTGQGGGTFPHDPMDRLTIPGLIKAIDRQTQGRVRGSDFAPLPCSHPQCVSLTYMLRLNDGSYLPFPRFIDVSHHLGLLRSSATLGSSPEMQETLMDVIHDVYARQDTVDRAPEVLAALRRVLLEMFPDRPMTPREAVRMGEGQAKSIFIHHYMDRHDFDLERLRKCCHHYPQVDGRIMPACGFNMFHRGAAKGPDTPLPSWGKKPWTRDSPSLPSASPRLPLIR